MELILEATTGRAVQSLYSEQDKNFSSPIFGSRIPVRITIVDRLATQIGTRIWEPRSLLGYDWIKAAIGQGFSLPIAGEFTGTYGVNTTATIVYNPTAQQIEDALNLIASIIAAGGVDVQEINPGLFTITFRVAGTRTQISWDNSNIAPLTTMEGGTLIEGTVSLKEVQTLRIQQNPPAFVQLSPVDDALPGPGATVTVLQVGGGGHNHKIRIKLAPIPYEGKWTATVGGNETTFIDWTGLDTNNVDTVAPALGALASVASVNNVSVVKEADGQWLIMFVGAKANTDMGAITVDATALKVLPGVKGTLLLNTPGMALLVGGADSVPASFQIEGRETGEVAPDEFFRKDVIILDSVIDPGSTTPTPTILFYTAEECDAKFAKITVAGVRKLLDDGTVQLAAPGGAFFKLTVTDLGELGTLPA